MRVPRSSVPERIDALAHHLERFGTLLLVLALLAAGVLLLLGAEADNPLPYWLSGLGCVVSLLWMRAISAAAAVLLWLALPPTTLAAHESANDLRRAPLKDLTGSGG
jgi:hypothetical protein